MSDLPTRLRASANRIYEVSVGDLDLLCYEARRAGCTPLSVRQGASLMDALRDYLRASANRLAVEAEAGK